MGGTQPLTRRDLADALDLVEETHAITDPDDLARHLVRALPRLVASDLTGYNEVNLRTRRTAFFLEPRVELRDAEAIFNRRAHQHPLIRHHLRSANGAPTMLSDFLTRPQLHRLGLYDEFFRPLRVEHQIAFTLSRTPGALVALGLNRTLRDFSERDRRLLAMLRPHLGIAFRNAERLTGLVQEGALLTRTAETRGVAVVRLTPSGRLQEATPTAATRLVQYFGSHAPHRGWLPDPVRHWVRRYASDRDLDHDPHQRTAMIVEREGKKLVLTLAGSTSRPLLLIEERRTPIKAGSLPALGLTEREADVLTWVAQGKTDAETAVILDISPRTVAKHLQHIFDKLGVATRTAAAARALEAAHDSSG